MRILIIEDEMTIAFMLEDMIAELGHDVVDTVARLEPALEAIGTYEIDLALLDVDLGGVSSFPIADALRERAVRYAFLTGYGLDAIPRAYAMEKVVMKPVSLDELRAVIEGTT